MSNILSKKIRVLVVDDSAFMRKIIMNILQNDPEIEVIGIAKDGIDALEQVEKLSPDVITLDVEMPKMDGLEFLKQQMSKKPLPVVMVSSLTQEGAAITLEALEIGAVDFVAKPSGSLSLDMHKVATEMCKKVKDAASARVRSPKRIVYSQPIKIGEPLGAKEVLTPEIADKLVIIGSSTGGPSALMEVIPKLPADLDAGVVVIQHMPPGFTNSLAERINKVSKLNVKEAERGDIIAKNRVLIAPGGLHLFLKDNKKVDTNTDLPVHGVRPAVDVFMESAAKIYQNRIVGVILTGMGFDGARGMSLIKRYGGRTIAQNEETCVVYGMPRAVVEMGLADKIAPLDQISGLIKELL
mgnify:CR=1 FL=1